MITSGSGVAAPLGQGRESASAGSRDAQSPGGGGFVPGRVTQSRVLRDVRFNLGCKRSVCVYVCVFQELPSFTCYGAVT